MTADNIPGELVMRFRSATGLHVPTIAALAFVLGGNMRLLLVLAAALCCLQTVSAQDNLDPHKIHDAVEINELVLVYFRADVERHKTEKLEDVVDHHVAITAADLDAFAYKLVDFALGYEAERKFDRATLSAHSPDNYLWTIVWKLFPKDRAFTGIPYHLPVHLTGKGSVIKPHAYLWSAYELPNGPNIRCALSVADCRADGKKARCHGDEILQRAKDALSQYTQGELAKLKERDSDVQIPEWRLHSLGLIDGFPDDLKIWRIDFVDGSTPDIATTVNNRRRFSIWAAEDGRVGQLSIGSASLQQNCLPY